MHFFKETPLKTNSLRALLYASPIYRFTLGGRVPDALRLPPPSFRLGDPEVGKAILNGTFILNHYRLNLGDIPWARPLSDPRQQADLHGFYWLADLFAAGSDDARARAAQLVRQWIDHHVKWQDIPWQPDVLGERLSAWLACFDFLTAQDEDLAPLLLDAAMRQARHLARSCTQAPNDARIFKAVQGLIFAAICLPGMESQLDQGLSLLEREISRQIFPDGGHMERNPSRLLKLLSRFNQIRALLVAGHTEVPVALQGAIDRISPMVRALRHGDGGLALFNGGYEEDRSLVDTVLADTGVRAKALNSAPHSGFQRMVAGRTVLIMDTGKPSKAGGAHTHAGTLSFEMSIGKDRLIVNCGTPSSEGDHWREPMRSTAAHSTLAVDERNSTEFKADGTFSRAPQNVECHRREGDGAIWLDTSHDGYRKSAGVLHRRKLYLSAAGEDFRGEDIVEGSGGSEFTLRFHLHPGVHTSLVPGRSAVLLKLPSGAGWQFQATGGTMQLEESVYLSGHGEARRCEQIILRGPLHGDGAQVKWRFHKL